MKKTAKAILIFLILFAFAAAASAEDFALFRTLEEIRAGGVLRVGTAGDYQPMSYLDPETNTFVGFDAELAEDLAASLGVTIEYVKTSWPTLMEDTLAGKFRPGSLRHNGDRRPEGIGPDVRRLSGEREDLPDAALIIHDVNQEIPGLVASGEADVMITEVMEAGFYVGQDDRLAAPLIFEPFTNGQLGFLMPKGSENLLDYVNRFLLEEKESGRIDELAEKYIYRYIRTEEELEPAA